MQEETLITENWNAMVDGATHDDAPVAVDGCVDKAVFASRMGCSVNTVVGCNNAVTVLANLYQV